VGAADVPLVGARMHGQAIGAGLLRNFGETEHVGHAGMAGIAEQRDLVEVDAEPGHFWPNSKIRASRTVSRSRSWAAIIGAVSAMISSTSRISLNFLNRSSLLMPSPSPSSSMKLTTS